MNKTLEKVKEYYEKEYKEIESLLLRTDRPSWVDPKKIISHSIHRCLGVAQFVQSIGVAYEDLECYEEIKEKLEKLLDNINKQ